jgi:ATP-dependent exoDNAse (exonuclease V) beta subunit
VSDDARLLIADDKARVDALDASRSFIVQAPAGSGKTELLIQRYLRLLSLVQEPEEILAITFTRKAAFEMHARVNDALDMARKGVIAAEVHRQKTIELALAALQRDQQNGWRLGESPQRMRIQTLDSFCASIAASLPVSSGLGGVLTTIADAEMQSVYRRAAAATLDWITADNEQATAIERLLVHLDNHTGLYIDYLARMLETRDQWMALIGSGAQADDAVANNARQRLEESIRTFISAQLARLVKAFAPALRKDLLALLRYATRNVLEAGIEDHALVPLDGIGGFPEHRVSDLPAWRAISSLLLTKEGKWRKTVTKNDGFPPGDHGEKKQLQEMLVALQSQEPLRTALQRARSLPEPAYDDKQWQVLLALFRVMPLAVAELRRAFSERGVSDHTEVALAAAAALGHADVPGDVALRLDYTIKHILIDEMQDTSVGQYRLIGRLIDGWSPGDGRTLFCVGDPMQSIYRFRDAEVGRFLQLREDGFGSVPLESLVLRRNFRSGANLVRWFNTTFSRVLPIADDIAEGLISYSQSVPVEPERGEGVWRVHALFGAGADEEADYGRAVIQKCLADGSNQTCAVLVRSRAQLPILLNRLRGAGIRYTAVEIDRLTDLPEIVDLLALTRAMAHEGDRLAWLALLRAPWIGLTWIDLHRLVFNDSSRTVPELMKDGERLCQLSEDAQQRLERLAANLERHFIRRPVESFRDRVESAWFALGGPALLRNREQLENVYRYFDIVEKIESAGTLIDIAELESRLNDERVSSIVDDPYAVQVMTMHKAKGLEFDQVVLYALGRSTRGRRKSIMSWMNLPNRNNTGAILLSPVGPRAELENDRLHQCIQAAESDKDRLELDRLLYVACTRARRALHLIGSVPLTIDRKSFRPPPAISLLGRLWPAVEGEFASSFAAGEGICSGASEPGSELMEPVSRRFQRPFELPAPPELPVEPGRAASAESEIDIEFYWVGLAARHAGTIVHKWLTQMAQGTLRIDAANAGSLRPASLRMAQELGVPDALSAAVCDRVEQALLGVLQDSRGRWLLSGDGFTELPLSGVFGDQTISIVIDRVRIEAGVHWIVDYKTSSHEGGDLAGFLGQEADRYRPQLQRYATLYKRLSDAPVRTALYFPLLREFREVAVD